MRRVAFAALTLVVWRCAAAQVGCNAPSADCAPVGEWSISVSIGAGVRSNPVRENGNIPLVALPHVSYYGKRFFLDSLDLGVFLHETDSNTLSLVATPGYDRVFFIRNDLQNLFYSVTGDFLSADPTTAGAEGTVKVPARKPDTTYLAGPEWIFRYGKMTGQVEALREITGHHGGYEARAALSTPLIETRGSLIASAGLTWKSAQLVRYYYGVKGHYEPGAAVNPFVKVAYALPLSERWSFTAFANYEHLGAGIAGSPVVSQRHVLTVFSGFDFSIW